MLKFFCEHPNFNIDFNNVDQDGWTILHHACFFGQLEVIQFLLEHANEMGLDVTKKNNSFKTAEEIVQGRLKLILELFEMWHLKKALETLNFDTTTEARFQYLKQKHCSSMRIKHD